MIIITNFDETHFTLNGVKFAKIYQPLAQGSTAIGIYSIYDNKLQLVNSTRYDEYEIDGSTYATQALTIAAILDVIIYQLSPFVVEQLDDRVTINETSIINLDSRIDSNDTDISGLDSRVDNLESNQVTGVETYETLAGLPGTGTLLVSYKVTNDATSANNGYYHWNGSIYVKDASLVLNTFDENNTSDAFSGEAIDIYERSKTDENNRLLLNAVPSWYSDYLHGDAISVLKSSITLQNTGDFIELKVKLRNLGTVASDSQSMGMCGQLGTPQSNIGVFYTGKLYIRSVAGVWLSTDGFIDSVVVDNEDLIIRLEWTASEIKTYRNGVFQKNITKGDILIENFGYAYNSTIGGSYNGLISDIKMSHSGSTLVDIDSPFFNTDLVDNTDVDVLESDEVFLTDAQALQLESNTDDIAVLETKNYAKCYVTYDPTGSSSGNELFEIYVQNEGADGTLYYKFTVGRVVDLSEAVYSNHYRLLFATMSTFNGSAMSSTGDVLLNSGESECVYRIASRDDFSGGFHGDELFTQIDFYFDKVRLTAAELLSPFTLRACSEFLYVQKSTVHETEFGGVPNPVHPTESLHDKWTVFRNSGFETRNRFIWQQNLSVTIAYLSLITLAHDLGEYGQTDNYNIVQFDQLGGNKLSEVNDNVHIWNETKGYSAAAKSEFDVFNDTSSVFVWDSPVYNKWYRDTGAKSVVTNEVWNATTILKILKD